MAKSAEHERQRQADRARRQPPPATSGKRDGGGARAAADRYGQLAKTQAKSNKPSYRKSVTAGAAQGAAAGPEGAAAGAAMAVAKTHGEKKAAAKMRRAMRSPARKLLVAEYIVCMIILAFSPLTGKHGSDGAVKWMKRGTAMSVVFLLLGILSSGGPRAEKVSAAFGGLITIALVMNDRDIFGVMATRLAGSGPAATGTDTTTGPHGSGGNKTGAISP